MIYNNVILTVKAAADIERVAALLQQQAASSRGEAGCLRFEVYQSESEPAVFMLIEHWQSEAHLAAHREADGFTRIYKPQVLPLVERTPHLCRLLA